MKLKSFQKKLLEKKVDGALLFFRDPNFFYFTQQNIDNSILLIPAKGKPLLFVNKLEDVNVPIKKIIYDDPYKDLKSTLKKLNLKILGINEFAVTVKQKKIISKAAKTVDIEKILRTLRETKTDEEIKNIRKACSITENVLSKIVKHFYFKTEKEVKDFIKIEAIKEGCELSFEPVVASGKGASTPHYSGNKSITKGFMIIDMGVKYRGYCADITRTLYIGKPSNKELDLYNKILSIQKLAIKMIKPNQKISEIEAFVRKKLGPDDKYFTHSLGHGLGIDVHESPTVSIKSKKILEKGMVITIEPGLYNQFGIRIEDDVLVTKKGYALLSKFSKALIIPKF